MPAEERVQYARLGLGRGDKLRQGLDAGRGIDDQHAAAFDHGGYRDQIAHGIVGHMDEVRCHTDRQVDGKQERVAVRLGLNRRLRPDRARRARTIIDHRGYAPILRHFLRVEPDHEIGRPGRKRQDEVNRARGICIRNRPKWRGECEARRGAGRRDGGEERTLADHRLSSVSGAFYSERT